ncbi:MAG TPA: aconitate hydratase AcnA [Candidatus Omnitrophota bacterium]|nr:aconitate hydratase AcnA [Candidatus Omnitrophota bacterium]
MRSLDSFHTGGTLKVGKKEYRIFRLQTLKTSGAGDPGRLPFSLRVLLENLLRSEDGKSVTRDDIRALLAWDPCREPDREIAFMPARVLLQDFTGVPAVADLAAMRDAVRKAGGDPERINPLFPVDLVIDHSVQVDFFGNARALEENTALEFGRNQERYQFLRWAQAAFRNFRVVPPGTGIVHQVNLEYLASVICARDIDGISFAFPDTLVGTDSHTTTINGLGVVGWGVGGIEAEAAMLGQPISMLIPQVIGVRLKGKLPRGANATDLVLTLTEILRKKNVVGKFVEFFGEGLDALTLPDRTTVANMAPEYGATLGFFPVDDETLNYLKLTGRGSEHVDLARAYVQEQGLFRKAGAPDPVFSDVVELDLASIQPSLAGPKRPQDRVLLGDVKNNFAKTLEKMKKNGPLQAAQATGADLNHGAVVLAAITSCTNTSNPYVMLEAGILAKKAAERGLSVPPWVKTSLAPGSRVVMDYLDKAGLTPYLEKLNFYSVGFGCTTCIGNSGPLVPQAEEAIRRKELIVAAVLSGNRNFEGRIHSSIKANYLASPALVIAFAIAGTVNADFLTEPLGRDSSGRPVFLREIWPDETEVREALRAVDASLYAKEYGSVFDGDERWKAVSFLRGTTFEWNPRSTYVRRPPFLEEAFSEKPRDISGARALLFLGDSVTTDHISPAGSIPAASPAGVYLISEGIAPGHFNSYGSRRGNHEVMMRGTFANIRLKNKLVPNAEGGLTKHFPDGAQMPVYEAAVKYREEKVPLIVLAGKEYGTGSSRDWAAKGPRLLGIRAVIAESFERIHRSNLVGMGILPLQFEAGSSAASLGLSGEEVYDIDGIEKGMSPRKHLAVRARNGDRKISFNVFARIDTAEELVYFENGGILPYVFRQLLR